MQCSSELAVLTVGTQLAVHQQGREAGPAFLGVVRENVMGLPGLLL